MTTKKKKKKKSAKLPKFTRRPEPGALPGTLSISQDADAPKIKIVQYNADRVVEETVTDVESITGFMDEETVTQMAHPLSKSLFVGDCGFTQRTFLCIAC